MSDDFQRAIIRELDGICSRFEASLGKIEHRFEQAVTRLEERDEERDSEVSELKLKVGLLSEDCKRNLKRDAGLVIAPTTIVTLVQALIQYWPK